MVSDTRKGFLDGFDSCLLEVEQNRIRFIIMIHHQLLEELIVISGLLTDEQSIDQRYDLRRV